MTATASLASISVRTARPYVVHVGRGALAQVAREVAMRSRCAIVTDTNVGPLHAPRLSGLVDLPALTLEPGEETKSLTQLENVLEFMAASGLDRRSCLVALGGGVVGDLAGLAASLYMRGIALVQAPTTLLAQVDSSVGGKTAVNLRAGKNLAGTFHQPSAVYADPLVLSTLAEDEYRSGLGEAVKTALLGNSGELTFVEDHLSALRERDPAVLGELVERCVRVKADLVQRDEREHGLRTRLNLGHTFAHAIEHAAGYGRVPHGLAVGVGLVLALSASRALGHLDDQGLPARVEQLLDRLGLEASIDGLSVSHGVQVTADGFRAGLRHDKKGSAGEPRLVLPRSVGRVDCEVEASEAFWERFYSSLP